MDVAKLTAVSAMLLLSSLSGGVTQGESFYIDATNFREYDIKVEEVPASTSTWIVLSFNDERSGVLQQVAVHPDADPRTGEWTRDASLAEWDQLFIAVKKPIFSSPKDGVCEKPFLMATISPHRPEIQGKVYPSAWLLISKKVVKCPWK